MIPVPEREVRPQWPKMLGLGLRQAPLRPPRRSAVRWTSRESPHPAALASPPRLESGRRGCVVTRLGLR